MEGEKEVVMQRLSRDINLLPEGNKRRLRAKPAVAAVVAGLVLAFLVMAPVYLRQGIDGLEAAVQERERSTRISATVKESFRQLAGVEGDVKERSVLATKPSGWAWLDNTLKDLKKAVPPGVTVEVIEVPASGGIVLEGHAPDLRTLLTMVRQLEQGAGFRGFNIEFPEVMETDVPYRVSAVVN